MAEITFMPIPNDDKIEYCQQIILREAKKEDLLVKQLFYSLLSMYSQNPINLAINAPSGEGKNYVIRKVVDLFPKEDVVLLSGMTEKSLYHRSGILVIKNEQGDYESIEDRIEKLGEGIEAKEEEMYQTSKKDLKHALKNQVKELEREKKELYKHAKNLIDLQHKALILLDTPSQGLFDAIMSTLSHDAFETEYDFVDTNNGIKTRTNVIRGWPVVIFAQATDYSWYKRYPEIQRRFIITNPKMDREKYAEAVDLLADRYGLPDFMYQAKVVSEKEKEQARELVKTLKERISDVSGSVSPGGSNNFVPYMEAIAGNLPKDRTSDITFANRILGYLSLITCANIENRPSIRLRKEGYPTTETITISTFKDLKEALYLVRNTSSVRPYVLDWYYDVFSQTYNNETEPKRKTDSKGKEIFVLYFSR